jgi:hypothetical protein
MWKREYYGSYSLWEILLITILPMKDALCQRLQKSLLTNSKCLLYLCSENSRALLIGCPGKGENKLSGQRTDISRFLSLNGFESDTIKKMNRAKKSQIMDGIQWLVCDIAPKSKSTLVLCTIPDMGLANHPY